MGKYDDIINLEHHVSKNHPQMSIYDRSAQFAPFAALTGYEESIKKAGEIYDSKIELSDDKIEELSLIFAQLLSKNKQEEVMVKVTYFFHQNDENNGKYIELVDIFKSIDITKKVIKIGSKTINFSDIFDLLIVK